MQTCLKPLTVPKKQKLLQETHQSQNGCGKGALWHPGFVKGGRAWPKPILPTSRISALPCTKDFGFSRSWETCSNSLQQGRELVRFFKEILNCESQACFLQGWWHREHLSPQETTLFGNTGPRGPFPGRGWKEKNHHISYLLQNSTLSLWHLLLKYIGDEKS